MRVATFVTIGLAASVLALPAQARQAPVAARTVLADLRQEAGDASTRLVIAGSSKPTFTYHSPDPLTLVVDIADVDDRPRLPARVWRLPPGRSSHCGSPAWRAATVARPPGSRSDWRPSRPSTVEEDRAERCRHRPSRASATEGRAAASRWPAAVDHGAAGAAEPRGAAQGRRRPQVRRQVR